MLHLLRKKTCLARLNGGKARLMGAKAFSIKGSFALLVFGGLLFSQLSFGQYGPELNRMDQDAKPYYFGMSIGINMARFQTELHPHFLENDSVLVAEPTNSGGITLGFQATTRLSNRFQLRFNPQLMFVERNIYYVLKERDIVTGDSNVTKKVESIIAAFPFQLKFQSDRIGNFRVYTMIGIKADIDMASNARAKKAEDLVKIEKYDFGPEFGLGFNFYFPAFTLSPEIKISNGLRNLHARDVNLKYSNVFDRIQSRMIVFTIHIEG